LLALLAKELAFEPDRARRLALADEAIALARQASDPRTLAAVLESSCYAIAAPDTLATRSEQVRELGALVAQVGDLHFEFVASLREMNTAIELGDFGRADAALERAQAIAEQTRQPTQRWNAGFVAAGMMCMRGELEAGERLAEQALRLGQEAGQPDTAVIYGGTIVVNRMVQGRGAEVIALIERMVTEYPGVAQAARRPTPTRSGRRRKACRGSPSAGASRHCLGARSVRRASGLTSNPEAAPPARAVEIRVANSPCGETLEAPTVIQPGTQLSRCERIAPPTVIQLRSRLSRGADPDRQWFRGGGNGWGSEAAVAGGD
jgi:hypothetical protein